MKKYKILTALIMTGVLSLFGFTQIASAEIPSIGESEAEIEFTEGTGSPSIVDPTNPEDPFPVDPADPNNPTDSPTGNTGPLTLDYVSSIHFGEHEIDGGTKVYEAETLKPFIQVTDRRGTGTGWAVTAKSSEFTQDEATTLSGSIIGLNGGEAVSAGNSEEPTSVQSVVLNPGGDSASVVTAAVNQGLGTWVNRWFPTDLEATLNNNVTLEVPGGAATIADHAATITWTLTDGPGQ